MTKNMVHEVVDQLENLSAHSPRAQHATQLPAVQADMLESTVHGSVPDALNAADQQAVTPTLSELTEVDDSFLQLLPDPAAVSQLGSTGTQFLNPAPPSVNYQVSPKGLVTLSESAGHTTEAASPHLLSPALGFTSFEQHRAQSSPLNSTAAQTTQPSTSSLTAERIVGPSRPIPATILTMLENWHVANPDTEHPAAIAGRALSAWKNFKVFNDDADEYELSMFQIAFKAQKKKTLNYRIMVLHSPNGMTQLVVYGQPHPRFNGKSRKGTKGIYLLDWLEVDEHGEAEACGIKLWRTDNENITFSAQIADSEGKCLPASGPVKPANVPRPVSTPKQEEHADDGDDGDEIESGSSDQPLLLKSTRQFSFPKARIPNQNNGDEFVPPRALGSPWKPQEKRRRGSLFELNFNAHSATPIRYKLTCDLSNHVRVFKTNDAQVLFQRAREFYNGTDKPMRLLCTVPGVEGVRYLGEGCTDEFDILQEDIRKASGGDYENVVVEVKAYNGA
ncbi:hypothetical protein N7457_005581 [Penicillium paradoxum]|uniref:uncharacterized protein n=1 Tax=Penicillium paradoxum TaxID=176176 RepID=UPI0025476ACA|nr:uncharacterized protein N7457_005581 [Penicillium paradoxum]KAJ5780421.1 hypothetical protein N7457_005581 [Penicillium paradoxum]